MADITITTRQLVNLYQGIRGIDDLQPPLSPKGRYALSRAAQKVEQAVIAYERARNALARQHAKVEGGKPLSQGNGYVIADPMAFQDAHDQILDEPVTLENVRPITRAEIGDCPLPLKSERYLLGILIVDEDTPPQ